MIKIFLLFFMFLSCASLKTEENEYSHKTKKELEKLLLDLSKKENPKKIEQILKLNKIDPNMQFINYNHTGLHISCKYGLIENIKIYIKYNFDFNILSKKYRDTPLILSSYYKQNSVSEYLLKKGANPNYYNIYNHSVYYYSFLKKNNKLIKLLNEKYKFKLNKKECSDLLNMDWKLFYKDIMYLLIEYEEEQIKKYLTLDALSKIFDRNKVVSIKILKLFINKKKTISKNNHKDMNFILSFKKKESCYYKILKYLIYKKKELINFFIDNQILRDKNYELYLAYQNGDRNLIEFLKTKYKMIINSDQILKLINFSPSYDMFELLILYEKKELRNYLKNNYIKPSIFYKIIDLVSENIESNKRFILDILENKINIDSILDNVFEDRKIELIDFFLENDISNKQNYELYLGYKYENIQIIKLLKTKYKMKLNNNQIKKLINKYNSENILKLILKYEIIEKNKYLIHFKNDYYALYNLISIMLRKKKYFDDYLKILVSNQNIEYDSIFEHSIKEQDAKIIKFFTTNNIRCSINTLNTLFMKSYKQGYFCISELLLKYYPDYKLIKIINKIGQNPNLDAQFLKLIIVDCLKKDIFKFIAYGYIHIFESQFLYMPNCCIEVIAQNLTYEKNFTKKLYKTVRKKLKILKENNQIITLLTSINNNRDKIILFKIMYLSKFKDESFYDDYESSEFSNDESSSSSEN